MICGDMSDSDSSESCSTSIMHDINFPFVSNLDSSLSYLDSRSLNMFSLKIDSKTDSGTIFWKSAYEILLDWIFDEFIGEYDLLQISKTKILYWHK